MDSLISAGFRHRRSVDNLIHAHKVPPIVTVLIDNPPESRGSNLEYNLSFVHFLADELLSWLHERCNVTRDPQNTIIGGYSMGGAAAAFAASGDLICSATFSPIRLVLGRT
jgi:enterochelin esterase-like enzyme